MQVPLHDLPLKICNVCLQRAAKKCARCGSMWYCSVEHQKKDWAQHKKVCIPPNAFLQFAEKVYQHEVKNNDENRDATWIAVGRIFPRLLESYAAKHNAGPLAARFACVAAQALFRREFLSEATDWFCLARRMDLGIMPEIIGFVAKAYDNDLDAPSLDAKMEKFKRMCENPKEEETKRGLTQRRQQERADVVKKTGIAYDQIALEVKIGAGIMQRSQEAMFAGQQWFSSHIDRHTPPGYFKSCEVSLERAGSEGFDMVAAFDIRERSCLFVEEAQLVSNFQFETSCWHCTTFFDQQARGRKNAILVREPGTVVKQPCRQGCGFLFCSEGCERKAWDKYHAPLCHPDVYHYVTGTMRTHVQQSKSGSGLFPLLHFKLLGMALVQCDVDKLMDLWQQPPFRFYARPRPGTDLALSALPTHYEHLVHILQASGKLSASYLPTLTMEWVLRSFGLLSVNAFAADDDLENRDQRGVVLGTVTSLFNHSCDNNASWLIREGVILMASTKFIGKGESIRVSYSPDPSSFPYVYGFECKCVKCAAP